MTKSGHDQQQTMPVCSLYIQEWLSVSLLCLIVDFVAFVVAICGDLMFCSTNTTWSTGQHLLRSWPRMVMISSKQRLFALFMHRDDCPRAFCVWLLSLPPLLRRFDVLFHEHDMVNRTTVGQERPKSAATRPLMLCIYVGAWVMCFLWFIVAFAVLVVVIWVVSGVDMSGTTQQLVLWSWSRTIRISDNSLCLLCIALYTCVCMHHVFLAVYCCFLLWFGLFRDLIGLFHDFLTSAVQQQQGLASSLAAAGATTTTNGSEGKACIMHGNSNLRTTLLISLVLSTMLQFQ
jgi:hypothetical protein